MPFTLAHAAAALPFRRLRLVTSALVVGTLAPDFEYFIRLSPGGGFGHTFLGAFVFTLPLGLLVLWIFHTVVKLPAVSLLPIPVQRRLVPYLERFRFFGVQRFVLIVVSLLLGIATHILWDSVTHANRWPARHWQFLSETVRVPMWGTIPYFKLLQHGSTFFGILVLMAWCVLWYLTTKPSNQPLATPLSALQRLGIVCFGIVVATAGAVVRVLPDAVAQTGPLPWKRFLGYAICTWIALAWWQLVGFGLMSSRRNSNKRSEAVLRGTPPNPSS